MFRKKKKKISIINTNMSNNNLIIKKIGSDKEDMKKYNDVYPVKKTISLYANNKIKKYTQADKKCIITRINILKLSEHELFHIFKIMSDHNNNTYTKNKNGIFFNLKNTSDLSLAILEDYIHILQNRKNNIPKDSDNSTEDSESNKYSLLEYENIYDNNYHKLSNYEKTVYKKNKYFLEKNELR